MLTLRVVQTSRAPSYIMKTQLTATKAACTQADVFIRSLARKESVSDVRHTDSPDILQRTPSSCGRRPSRAPGHVATLIARMTVETRGAFTSSCSASPAARRVAHKETSYDFLDGSSHQRSGRQ